ncbi:MAG: ATP synthase subunit [Alphaproteobacteria bacterium]|nr:ATP synthase subunit [Alphaproteobacteria bacterium]
MDNNKKFEDKIEREIERRLAARGEPIGSGVWRAASLFGLVGWGVAAPVALFTYIGTLFGDRWTTLCFILGGILFGLYNTYRFIKREIKQ